MADIIKVKKGTLIFNEGDESSCMYYVAGNSDAAVGIYNDYGTPYEKKLTEITVDHMFGEIGVFTGAPRSASAVALTDVMLKKVSREDLKDYVRERPFVVLEVLKTTSENLRRLTRDYTDACVTLNDYVKAKASGDPVTPELAERLKKYHRK